MYPKGDVDLHEVHNKVTSTMNLTTINIQNIEILVTNSLQSTCVWETFPSIDSSKEETRAELKHKRINHPTEAKLKYAQDEVEEEYHII